MEDDARHVLAAEGFGAEAVRLVRSADLKVVGQTYELTVRCRGRSRTGMAIAALVDAFGQLYRERYAFFFEGEPIELVNLRLAASGVNEPIKLRDLAAGYDPALPGGHRPPARLFRQARLRRNRCLRPRHAAARHDPAGPAVVEEPTSVTLIPPGCHGGVAPDLGLFVKMRGAS